MADVLLTDIDGTLVDSNALHAEAWRRTFEHFGIQVGLDEAWRKIGKGGDHVIPVFVPDEDRERLERPLKDFLRQGGPDHLRQARRMEDLIDEASSSADAKASKPDADIFAAASRK